MYTIHFENGQSFPIKGFSLIGRNPDKSVMETAKVLIIKDVTKTISKTHAAIAEDHLGNLLIEDLDSINGTFIEGAEEFERQVLNGEPQKIISSNRVRLGDVYFRISQS